MSQPSARDLLLFGCVIINVLYGFIRSGVLEELRHGVHMGNIWSGAHMGVSFCEYVFDTGRGTHMGVQSGLGLDRLSVKPRFTAHHGVGARGHTRSSVSLVAQW